MRAVTERRYDGKSVADRCRYRSRTVRMSVMLPPGHAGTRVEHREDGAWLFLDRPWDERTAEEFDQLNCVGLWLNEARGWRPGPDGLSFLPSLNSTLRHLLIFLRRSRLEAMDEVCALDRLTSLTLPTEGLAEPLDLRGLDQLADLGVSGGRLTLGTMPRLQELRLVEDPREDLTGLSKVAGLRRLVIKSSRMQSLTGIEGQPIESVWLAGLRRLTDVSALLDLPHLRQVVIDDCKRAVVEAAKGVTGVKVIEDGAR
jgi:hypothetical protein